MSIPFPAFIILIFISVYLLVYSFIGYPTERKYEIRKKIMALQKEKVSGIYALPQKSFKHLFLQKLNTVSERLFSKGQNQKKLEALSQQLYSAGFSISASNYVFLLNVLTVVCGVLGAVAGLKMSDNDYTTMALMSVIGIASPYIIARFVLKAGISKRTQMMGRQLPDVLDLLSLSVDAGMGFDQAVQYVVDNMDGPFIDELVIMLREMQLGRTRKEALQHLSEKCGIESVSGFTSAVIQSSEMGISIRDVLRMQAKAIREARVAEVKEKAAKASIKMLIPMVLFIFPVLFIILMGPAVIQSIQNFAK